MGFMGVGSFNGAVRGTTGDFSGDVAIGGTATLTRSKNLARGSSTFNSTIGATIDITSHALETTDYKVDITPHSSSGFIGEISVESKAANSFVVKCSGSDITTGFDWEVIL